MASSTLEIKYMKYLFFVQGEGRGHLSQALALKEKLEQDGHKILGVIVGNSHGTKLPDFFQKKIKVPIFRLASPGFSVDRKTKGINIFLTILETAWHAPRYFKSLQKIRKIIIDLNPDVLVNFYEILAGNYYRLYHDQRPLFSIGHQYFIQHPAFKFPPGQTLSRLSFKFYNKLTAPQKSIKIALSFSAEKDQIKNNLFVCPPLIRQAIKDKVPDKQKFLLIYILNSGYSQEIIDWSKQNPQTEIKAFWDKNQMAETKLGPNLTFYRLSGEKFINYLASCQAYASTAGFDSISEAAYLQKPILMVPTRNHFEQKCNMFDAKRIGLALSSKDFNLSLLVDEADNIKPDSLITFKTWVDNYDQKIIELLEKAI